MTDTPLILIIICLASGFLHAQNKAKEIEQPMSVCDLMRHPGRYNNREVFVRDFYQIEGHNSPLLADTECPKYVGITAGPDENFEKNNGPELVKQFEESTDLYAVIDATRPEFHLNRWCCFLRMGITVHGRFLASHKRQYGPMNAFKLALLFGRIELISKPKLMIVGEKEERLPPYPG